MGKPRPRTFWGHCRRCVRWGRIGAWLVLLAVVSAAVYLNKVGVPDFVKRPLQENLRAQGLDVEFLRLRWRWYRGLVADRLQLGPTNAASGFRLTCDEVELQLDKHALLRRVLQVNQLVLRRGELRLPTRPEAPADALAVSNLNATLVLAPGDVWRLDDFRAHLAGINFRLSGAITNASALRHSAATRSGTNAPTDWAARWQRAEEIIRSVHFEGVPEVVVRLSGDATNQDSFETIIDVRADAARSPWGEFRDLESWNRLSLLRDEGAQTSQVRLKAGWARTDLGELRRLNLEAEFRRQPGNSNQANVQADLRAASVTARGFAARGLHFTGQWEQSFTNWNPASAAGRLQLNALQVGSVDVRQVDVTGHYERALEAATHPAIGFWTNLLGHAFGLQGRAASVAVSNFVFADVSGAGAWQSPELTLTNLAFDAGRSHTELRGALSVPARVLQFELQHQTDMDWVRGRLPTNLLAALAEFVLRQPPWLAVTGHVVLPPWTQPWSDFDWVRDSLAANGEFRVPDLGYRSLPPTAIHSRFKYSDQQIHLPDLDIRQPDGGLEGEVEVDLAGTRFRFSGVSTINPLIFRPFLDERGQRGLDRFAFTTSPRLEADVRGNWREWETLTATGQLAVTNFGYRDLPVLGATARFAYSNQVIRVAQPHAWMSNQNARAEGLTVDLRTQMLHLTNAEGHILPQTLGRAIGPQSEKHFAPYRFGVPAAAKASGAIPLRGSGGADLHVDADGGPFSWWKFNLPQITGHLHWMGSQLAVERMTSASYAGQLAGHALFVVEKAQGTPFEFDVTATNVDFHELMADLTSPTNNLQGRLDAHVVVTRANATDWRTVQGFGQAVLRDGLIWDFPLFGVASTLLNTVAPGVGNSRASAATGTFLLTNGVVRTKDLEIHASAMRLAYNGDVDLAGHVDARMEVQLLRDTILIGKLFSTVLWPVSKLFEVKVTGTLWEPKTQPLYLLPKVILAPLRPFSTLKSLFGEGSSATNVTPTLPPRLEGSQPRLKPTPAPPPERQP